MYDFGNIAYLLGRNIDNGVDRYSARLDLCSHYGDIVIVSFQQIRLDNTNPAGNI